MDSTNKVDCEIFAFLCSFSFSLAGALLAFLLGEMVLGRKFGLILKAKRAFHKRWSKVLKHVYFKDDRRYKEP